MFLIFFIYIDSEVPGPFMKQERTASRRADQKVSTSLPTLNHVTCKPGPEQSLSAVPATPGQDTPLLSLLPIKKHTAQPMPSGQEKLLAFACVCVGPGGEGVVSAMCRLLAQSHLILSTILDRCYYYLHLGDGKTETSRSSEP